MSKFNLGQNLLGNRAKPNVNERRKAVERDLINAESALGRTLFGDVKPGQFYEAYYTSLYNYYKATGKGVNCRQLAISLCEMYLSMGIPARYVTCMPADSLDYECHVINTVWSSQLQKWLYIDPTMDAWVTDENGTLLSIAEVRERLINDQPLVLCETANWNHESQQTKEYYLETYMAKNLYYFVCKKLNRFNPESVYRDNDPEGDVRLIPVGFVNNNWKCDTTTDPEVFWAKPE